MDVVLVRHGVPGREELAMNAHGRHQIVTLSRALEMRETVPDLLFSSGSEHALETAALLAQRLAIEDQSAQVPVVLDGLTPGGGPGGFDELIRQARAVEARPEQATCLLIVGHEGRLSDLVIELTGARTHPLSHGGAICIRGAALTDLAAGRGELRYRYPTVDHQEEPLRAKVNSKMTMSTFLAGFVFTALSTLLLLDTQTWPWHRVLAASTLTAALALFVASVYIFDQLGTPSGFWTDADKPRAFWRKLFERREARLERRWASLMDSAVGVDEEEKGRRADDDVAIYRRLHDGPVYWTMVHTSRFVFTPAVILALAGFAGLLIGTDWQITAFGLLGLTAAGAYCSLHRPDLGAD